MRIGKTAAPRGDSQHIDTLIGEMSSFKGELSFDGIVRIDGAFEGNLQSAKSGTLIVSETARIIGEVDVPKLVLHGVIKGNIRARESLQISATGRVTGDVEYKIMTLAEGAAINGRCNRLTDKPGQVTDARPAAALSDVKTVQTG